MKKPWSSPDDVRASVRRLWEQGRILAARLGGEALFPLEIPLRVPSIADMGEQFGAVQDWARQLQAGSGYELSTRVINHRQLGRQQVPVAARFVTADDALRAIGCLTDARRFDQLAAVTLATFPELRAWVGNRALTLLDQADEWERILVILQWFRAHPRPALYLRQLDIAGVDTKFIEAHKALLAELLDLLLPPSSVQPDAIGARQFEQRYGLLGKPPMLRFRLLDPALYIAGLHDLTVPLDQFMALLPPATRVYVTENEINMLAFPQQAGAMVIFGGGYAIDRLRDIAWLRACELVYWGDIDTHGFAILDRLRASMPHTRSIMMDAATLHAHRPLWGMEPADKRYVGELTRLDTAEQALFGALRDNVHGQYVRMEQERIGYRWVKDVLGQ
ncbi:Wadjet anti-phage system protein JetD domain-containing protein [Massilia sp. S19_KUP03_FR1]|uniref:Wadjet anti-phage system protein JetD domain-containing protein n=1 Tax=Massilia sp. S19_KUP03_FR1 TaxID=3025503 RepID=UPI002FCD9035